MQHQSQIPRAQVSERTIVIGASAGGVKAILALAATLPPAFPAPVLFVLHIGAHRSELPKLVSAHGPNPACHPIDGEVPRPGRIYIAPPDQHMLLDEGAIRLSRGPKEHHARPAIDPLFRSAAIECGPRAIGVVLTGMLDDGSSGLLAIKDCGGTAVVQDPADAREPSMPRSALSCVNADHVVPLEQLGPLLHQLALDPSGQLSRPTVPMSLLLEHQITTGAQAIENLKLIGSPSPFSCPDCGGVMFELGSLPIRYRCHTGHAFSLRSMAQAQEKQADWTLWAALRTLQEKEALLRRMAALSTNTTPARMNSALLQADALATLSGQLFKLVTSSQGGGDDQSI